MESKRITPAVEERGPTQRTREDLADVLILSVDRLDPIRALATADRILEFLRDPAVVTDLLVGFAAALTTRRDAELQRYEARFTDLESRLRDLQERANPVISRGRRQRIHQIDALRERLGKPEKGKKK